MRQNVCVCGTGLKENRRVLQINLPPLLATYSRIALLFCLRSMGQCLHCRVSPNYCSHQAFRSLGCLIAASIETENKAAAQSFTSVFQQERIEEQAWNSSFALLVAGLAIMFGFGTKTDWPLTQLLRCQGRTHEYALRYGDGHFSVTYLRQNSTYPNAGYPDRIGTSDKFVENSTKLTCPEITGYRIKYSTQLWLVKLQIRRG